MSWLNTKESETLGTKCLTTNVRGLGQDTITLRIPRMKQDRCSKALATSWDRYHVEKKLDASSMSSMHGSQPF